MNVLEDLAGGKRTPEIQHLIEQFVVLGMPEHYLREVGETSGSCP